MARHKQPNQKFKNFCNSSKQHTHLKPGSKTKNKQQHSFPPLPGRLNTPAPTAPSPKHNQVKKEAKIKKVQIQGSIWIRKLYPSHGSRCEKADVGRMFVTPRANIVSLPLPLHSKPLPRLEVGEGQWSPRKDGRPPSPGPISAPTYRHQSACGILRTLSREHQNVWRLGG